MSRRTKLLITALFLVLLAIPAGYMAVTWSPAGPLTFCVVPLRESSTPSDDLVTQVGVRVENTSATTIYLRSAVLHSSPEPVWGIENVGSISSEYQATRRRLGTRDFVEIPPRGSIDVMALVASKRVNDANAGRVQVTYVFMSSTKCRTTELGVWLCNFLPEKLSSKMPLPGMDTTETALGEMTD